MRGKSKQFVEIPTIWKKNLPIADKSHTKQILHIKVFIR